MNRILVSSSVIAIAVFCAPAHAQQAAEPTAQTSPGSDDGVAPDQASEGSDGQIIVTARRRAENLQDVPIAITALSGSTLVERGVRDVYDLQSLAPSLAVTTNTPSRSSVSYAIRGQRTNEAQLLTDPPVGAYFAEVVMPRTYGFGAAFYDIQNVQVLKGVQGTLFGRNMTGGAVLIEPNHPDATAFHADGAVQYGNFNLVDITGMVNVPLIADVLAIRVAGKYRDRKGFTRDISTGRDFDDQHYYSFRPSIELKLPNFNSFTVFDYLKSDENGTGAKLIGFTSTDPRNGSPTVIGSQIGATASGFFPIAAGQPLQNLPAILGSDLALGRFRVNYGNVGLGPLDGNPGAPYLRIKNWGITNKTTLTVGEVTFKNIFGYREIDYVNHADYDGSAAAFILPIQLSNTRDVSEEFQMQGTPFGSRFELTLGAFYFRESGEDGTVQSTFPQLTSIGFASPFLATNPALANYFLSLPARSYGLTNIGRGVATSYAFYGAGTYTLTDQLKLSGGIRYNNDHRRATVTPVYLNLAFPGQTAGVCAYNGLGTFTVANCSQQRVLKNDAVTWDATIQFEPDAYTNLYASIRQGFRAGGFSLRAQDDVTFAPFQPEKVREYEIGLKKRFDIGAARLTTSGAVYYQDYTDVQKSTTVISNGSVATIITNTAVQRNYGGEVEANLALPNGLSANAYYSYSNNEVVRGGNGAYPMQGVPRHQLGGGISYAATLDGIGELNVNVSAMYRSSVPLDEYDAIAVQKGYGLVNGRLSISDIGGSNFGLAVFANNITNTYYMQGVISLVSNGPVVNGINPGGGPGYAAAVFGEPRTYGVEASFRF